MPSPTAIIHRHSGDPSRVQQLGPYAIEGFLERGEQLTQTVWRVRIAPHQTTAISYHLKAEETYYVLSGRGVALLNGQRHELVPGDFLRLPPGTRHGFITDTDPLEMLDVHAPGCWPDHDTYFEGAPPPGFTPPRS